MRLNYILSLMGILMLNLIVGYSIYEFIFATNYHSLPIIANMYLLVIVLGGHYILIKKGSSRPQAFANLFMGFISLKMMFSLLFLLIFLYLNKGSDITIPFSISFLFSYFSFTIFEVFSLIKKR